jgi:hypothetical protein
VIQNGAIESVHRVRARNTELIFYEDFVKSQSICEIDLNLADKKKVKKSKQYMMCELHDETKDKVPSTKNFAAI